MGNIKEFLDKDIIDKIIKNKSDLQLGVEKREITVSVTNMTRYVSIAETMPLDVLPEFMNKYFALNFDEIIKKKWNHR
jgi:class 3 adenylate cyclase